MTATTQNLQQDILINWSPQETRVAVVEGGSVQEIHIERSLERGLVGNIYLGKVTRVLPGMQSAFIDLGLERAGFLHIADIAHDGKNTAIEHLVFEGQSLLIQVIKDPIGTKGARLSTQISIAGRLLVFLPHEEHIGVSQKITIKDRDALRLRLQALVEAKSEPNQIHGGFILRTNGEDATDDELAEDINYLRKIWGQIKKLATQLPVTSILYEDLSLLQRVLRDLAGEHTNSIRIDSQTQFYELEKFGQNFMPSAAKKLQLYKGERPIFDLYSIEQEINKALGKRVELKSGGYLIVDQTEALTTIDVNTGGFIGARNFDDTIFKTNLEAAQAIARQLRLRNLGGIIIIDFIDMTQAKHKQYVLEELHRQLSRDRVKTVAGDFSQLGLVEMTRKRTRESLAHMLCEPCAHCAGKGSIKTLRTICYEILREILREARQFNPKEFRILANCEVVDLLLEEESQHLAELSDLIAKPISLQRENYPSQEQYDIILL